MSKHLALRSGNPALQSSTFRNHFSSTVEEKMTLSGTVNKTAFSLVLVVVSAGYSWGNPLMHGLSIPAAIIGFVLALVTIFKPTVGSPVMSHPKAIVSKVPTILQLRVFKILLVLDANMILNYLIETVFGLLSGVRGINSFSNPSFIEASILDKSNRLAIFHPKLKLRLAIPE